MQEGEVGSLCKSQRDNDKQEGQFRFQCNSQRNYDEQEGEVGCGRDLEVVLVDGGVTNEDADDEGEEVAEEGASQVPKVAGVTPPRILLSLIQIGLMFSVFF